MRISRTMPCVLNKGLCFDLLVCGLVLSRISRTMLCVLSGFVRASDTKRLSHQNGARMSGI